MRIYFLFYFIYLISFSSYSQEDKKAVDLLDMMSEKYKQMELEFQEKKGRRKLILNAKL